MNREEFEKDQRSACKSNKECEYSCCTCPYSSDVVDRWNALKDIEMRDENK